MMGHGVILSESKGTDVSDDAVAGEEVVYAIGVMSEAGNGEDQSRDRSPPRRDESKVDLNPKLKKQIILFVGSSGTEGVRLSDLIKSVRGFIYNCKDSSGERLSPLQVVREHLSTEIDVRNVSVGGGGQKNRLFIRDSFQEAYRAMKEEAEELMTIEKLKFSKKLRLSVLSSVADADGGVTMDEMLENVKGLQKKCFDIAGRVSAERFFDIMEVHFADEIDVRTAQIDDQPPRRLYAKDTIAVEHLNLSKELRTSVLSYVARGDVSMSDMLENIEELRNKCLDVTGRVSAQRFDDIMRVHFANEIEKEVIVVYRISGVPR